MAYIVLRICRCCSPQINSLRFFITDFRFPNSISVPKLPWCLTCADTTLCRKAARADRDACYQLSTISLPLRFSISSCLSFCFSLSLSLSHLISIHRQLVGTHAFRDHVTLMLRIQPPIFGIFVLSSGDAPRSFDKSSQVNKSYVVQINMQNI